MSLSPRIAPHNFSQKMSLSPRIAHSLKNLTTNDEELPVLIINSISTKIFLIVNSIYSKILQRNLQTIKNEAFNQPPNFDPSSYNSSFCIVNKRKILAQTVMLLPSNIQRSIHYCSLKCAPEENLLDSRAYPNKNEKSCICTGAIYSLCSPSKKTTTTRKNGLVHIFPVCSPLLRLIQKTCIYPLPRQNLWQKISIHNWSNKTNRERILRRAADEHMNNWYYEWRCPFLWFLCITASNFMHLVSCFCRIICMKILLVLQVMMPLGLIPMYYFVQFHESCALFSASNVHETRHKSYCE